MRKEPHYYKKVMNHFTITFSIRQEDNSDQIAPKNTPSDGVKQNLTELQGNSRQ